VVIDDDGREIVRVDRSGPGGAIRSVPEAELQRQYPELKFVRPEGEAVYRVKGATGKLLLKKALEHFASKAALDIEGLGEKNVAALVDAKLVHDMADIYTLTKEQIIELDRFADISAQNLVNGIAAAKTPELPRFMYGLGIRHVGTQTAIDLAEAFGSLDKLAHTTLDEVAKAYEGVPSGPEAFGDFLKRYSGEAASYRQDATRLAEMLKRGAELAASGAAWRAKPTIREGNIPKPATNLRITPKP